MKRSLLLLSLFFALSTAVWPCSIRPKFFCESINGNNSDYPVFMGKVIDTVHWGVRFEILERLKGEESRDTITIWDGKPFYCNGFHDLYAKRLTQLTDTIIVAVPKITQPDTSWQVTGDYVMPFFYGYISYLSVEAGYAKGYIAGVASGNSSSWVQSLSLDSLQTYVLDRGGCSEIVNTSAYSLDRFLQVFPNPFGNSLFLEVSKKEASTSFFYTLKNWSGQVMRQGTLKQQEQLTTDELPAGMYVLLILNREGTLVGRRKLLKN